MKVQIKYVKFVYMFGRQIAMGQMHDMEGKVLLDGSVAQMLTMIRAEGYELVNAQEVLEILVIKGGFAA